MFATGGIHSNSSSCLCVAIKRHIVVYELNRTKFRHLKIKVSTMCYKISSLFPEFNVIVNAHMKTKLSNIQNIFLMSACFSC